MINLKTHITKEDYIKLREDANWHPLDDNQIDNIMCVGIIIFETFYYMTQHLSNCVNNIRNQVLNVRKGARL